MADQRELSKPGAKAGPRNVCTNELLAINLRRAGKETYLIASSEYATMEQPSEFLLLSLREEG